MANNTEYFYNGISVEPISADPANPREGQVQFSDGTVRAKGLWQYKDGAWAAIGGSAGSLDIIYQADFNTDVDTSAFTTGNDAVFDNGGTVDGAIALESSSPISGAKSFKYTMSSSSTNDFIKSESINLDPKQKGQYVGISFYYTYDGDDDDITFIAYDDTNNEVLTDSVDLIKAQANPTRYSTSIYVPTDCSILNYGFQVGTGNNTKILTIDDVELTTNPFVYKNLIDRQYVQQIFDPASMTTTNGILRFGSVTLSGDNILSYDDSNGRFTANRRCHFIGMFSVRSSSVNLAISFYKNGTLTNREHGNDANLWNNVSTTIELEVGDYVEIEASEALTSGSSQWLTISAEAETEHVITPAKSNANVLSARIANSGTATIVSQGGVNNIGQNAVASVNRFAVGIVDITYTTGFFTVAPSVVSLVGIAAYTTTVINETTTGCRIYCTSNVAGADTDRPFNVVFARQGNDVKDSSFLAAIPTQLTAYIKDIKSDGTDGGTFTSGAWQTRDLNTIEADSSFVTLSSNQFTLPPGKYEIEASSCAYACGRHKIRIANVDDSTYSYGLNNIASTSGGVGFSALASTTIEITSSKTYEIQHRCSDTKSGDGFGIDMTFGVDEVYSIVKITKVK